MSWPPDEDTPSSEGEGCSGKRFSPHSCSRKQPASKDGVIYLVCLLPPGSCRAPSAAPVTWGRLPGRAPLARTARGLGPGKAATFLPLLGFTCAHTIIQRGLRGTTRFSSFFYKFAWIFFSLQSGYQPCIGDLHPNSGEGSLHLRRDLSDTTNTHRGLTSVIIGGI